MSPPPLDGTLQPGFRGIGGRARFAATPMAVIDLLASPSTLPMVLPLDLRVMRMLRILRIFRILKLYRYSDALRTLGRVLSAGRESLTVVGFVLVVLLVITSTLMYFVEHDARPDAFSRIPMVMWWAVAALTTVGYGDVYPITPPEKFLGGCIAVLGIGMFALPAGILASAFADEIRNSHRKKWVCPHCGNCIDDPSSGEEDAENRKTGEAGDPPLPPVSGGMRRDFTLAQPIL